MADVAGIVNAAGRDDDAAFSEVIRDRPPAVQALARAVRDLVFDVLPATVEVVWPRQRSVGWGTGPRKGSEQFAYLLPFAGHVSLGFYHGDELPDPAGLLPTTGGRMRSLRLGSVDEIGRPELRALIEVATRTGVPPPRG